MKHVLIVDDKEENLYLLRAVLEASGKTVTAAPNGAEALKELRNKMVDVIVSDILMPVMDGFSLCIACKKDPIINRIPFIFYTATYTDASDEAFALGLGADRFLTKPLQPEDIVREVDKALCRSDLGQAQAIPPLDDEKVVLKLYNQTLVRKLEKKMADLEAANKQLSLEIEGHKKAQAALEKNERLLRDIASSIPGVVYQFVLDPKGYMSFSYVSDGASAILGVPPPDIYGDAIKAFSRVHPEDFDMVMASISESAQGLKPWTMVFRAMHQEGFYRWVKGNSIPRKQDGGGVLWNGTFFDYTQIKDYQHNLESKNAELTKANTELDRFVYSASHDMRAPLTSIMGLIDITLADTTDATAKARLNMMHKSVEKLDMFIRKILEYSRNTRLDLAHDLIQWDKLISECIDDLRFMHQDSSIALLGEVSQETKFATDQYRLLVVLNNILSNAIKYSDPHKDKREVKVHVKSDHNKAIIQVMDNGIGIQTEHVTRIFEMFYRATSTSTGSGLGLYIAMETIHKLRGSIEVVSELGKGTTMTIEIPNLYANEEI
jgi:signal transduction histidine kinase/CheY-like chemotaxis protein